MSDLFGLPYQLLVDGVLSYLDNDSLLTLRRVSRSSRQLVDDDLVWRRKISQDFNFPITSSARMTGWQSLYKGLCNPELYTWGDYTYDRIGQELKANSLPSAVWNVIARFRGVPFPLKIRWRNAQTYVNGDGQGQEGVGLSADESVGVPIQIHSGGWSFYALTGQGQVLAWGRCADDASTHSHFTFREPAMLDLYNRQAKALTVGREHAVAQMDDGSLMEWSKRWDRPGLLSLSSLFVNHPSRSGRVLQVEAGWDFSAVLTIAEGEDPSGQKTTKTNILFWKTAWSELCQSRHFSSLFAEAARAGEAEDVDELAGSFPLELHPVLLPSLPEQVIKIAAGDDFIIALTRDHAVHYLALPSPGREIESAIQVGINAAQDTGNGRDYARHALDRATAAYTTLVRNRRMEWERLTMFCDDLYAAGARQGEGNVWDEEHLSHLVTGQTKITHISAQFRNFAVYAPDAGSETEGKGKGIVVVGNSERLDMATVMPQLQGIQVIKVTHGDWHHGALTLDGRVLTWGEKANGALGSWDALPTPDNALSTLQTSADARDPVARPEPPPRAMGIFGHLRWNRQRGPVVEPTPAEEVNDMVDVEKERYRLRDTPQTVELPLPVRFGFAKMGESREGKRVEADEEMETKYVFDIAFAGWHSGALAIDRSLLSDGASTMDHVS